MSDPNTGQIARIEVVLEALGRRGAELKQDEEGILFRRRIDDVAVRISIDGEYLVLHFLEDGAGPEEWRLSLDYLAETMIGLRRPPGLDGDGSGKG